MTTQSITFAGQSSEPRWLLSSRWDIGWLFASAGLVALVYLFYELGNQRTHVNMLVTLFIGGPHMFATYAWTVFEPGFKRRYRLLMPATLVLVPATVMLLGLTWFDMLLTGFFLLASLHVAEQFSYLSSLYTPGLTGGQRRRVRMLDFSLIVASLHMPAVYLLVRDEFLIGEKALLFPSFLQHEALWYAAVAGWLALAVLFLLSLTVAASRGRVLLIALAVPIALVLPTLDNLDVAFQGMNAWHSFQYLALLWLVTGRKAVSSPFSFDFIGKLTRKRGFISLYGLALAMTIGSGVIIFLLSTAAGFPYDEAYYLVVLSFLLVHYAFDHLLFSTGNAP